MNSEVVWIERSDGIALRVEGREIATYRRITEKHYPTQARFDSARIVVEANSGNHETLAELAAAVGETVTPYFRNRVTALADQDKFIDVPKS